MRKTNQKSFKVFSVILLCAVLTAGMLFAFTACTGGTNDYESFEEAKAAAAEQDKAILLYISKKPCPNCVQFDPYWKAAKEEYGELVIFYKTTLNLDSEAHDIYVYCNDNGPNKLDGAPSLVWMNSAGQIIQQEDGGASCNELMQKAFSEGLAGWWMPSA